MTTLTENEIFALINTYQPFSAYFEGESMHIRVDRYEPVIGTAIHSGASLRNELRHKIALTKDERFFEEDPMTDQMVSGCPIILTGKDSRYQYDLNRPPEACIYEEAWGKTVWKEALSKEERQKSLDTHALYYRILDVLLSALEKRYSRVILYDLHSYNYKRKGVDSPLFNIGTHFIDHSLFGEIVDDLEHRLAKLKFPGIVNRVGIDDVFLGKGYQSAYIRKHHPASLCIPLEIKKAYMDETTGRLFPEVIQQLSNTLKTVIEKNSELFQLRFCKEN